MLFRSELRRPPGEIRFFYPIDIKPEFLRVPILINPRRDIVGMGGDRYLVGVPRDRDRVPMVRDGDAVRVAGDRGRVGVRRNGDPVGVIVDGVGVGRYGVGVRRVDMSAGIHPYFVSVRNHGPVFIHAPIYCNPHSVMEAVVVDRLPGGLAREDVRAF